jgi:hypothetical protein
MMPTNNPQSAFAGERSRLRAEQMESQMPKPTAETMKLRKYLESLAKEDKSPDGKLAKSLLIFNDSLQEHHGEIIALKKTVKAICNRLGIPSP